MRRTRTAAEEALGSEDRLSRLEAETALAAGLPSCDDPAQRQRYRGFLMAVAGRARESTALTAEEQARFVAMARDCQTLSGWDGLVASPAPADDRRGLVSGTHTVGRWEPEELLCERLGIPSGASRKRPAV